ncbi:serine hydrolase domain-containing protein [Rhizobium ruizarguesonis]
MKIVVAIVSALIFIAANLDLASADQEPPKTLTVHPPAVPLRLPIDRAKNSETIPAYCGLKERCPLKDYGTKLGVCALYVLKDGVVRLEMFNNSDKIRCETETNGIDKMYGIASVTKSLTSTLLAQTLAERYHLRTAADFEKQLHRQVGSFLSEEERNSLQQSYSTVQLNQLLLMRSNIGWKEITTWPFRSDSQKFDALVREPPRKERLLDFATRYKLRRRSEAIFNYSALDSAMAIMIASKAASSGNPLKEFEIGLWSMIGAKHSAKWNVDLEGHPIGSCCFKAKIDDLARFGNFVLNQGQGKIPSAWFDLAKAAYPGRFDGVNEVSDRQDPSCQLGYGYFWWLRKGRDDFTAYGRDGQFIHIYPKEKVVIVQLSDWRETKVDSHARCISLKTHDQIVQRLSSAQ